MPGECNRVVFQKMDGIHDTVERNAVLLPARPYKNAGNPKNSYTRRYRNAKLPKKSTGNIYATSWSMAANAASSRRKRVRFTLDVNLESDIAKKAFYDKLATVRKLLTPRGTSQLNNRELILALFDLALSTHRVQQTSERIGNISAPSAGSFLRDAG